MATRHEGGGATGCLGARWSWEAICAAESPQVIASEGGKAPSPPIARLTSTGAPDVALDRRQTRPPALPGHMAEPEAP